MSDHKTVAESCAELCFAGLALAGVGATLGAFAVPIAVLGGYLLDIRGKCDKRMAESSVDAALKALKDSPDLTPTDLKAAAAWLKSRKQDLRLDPSKLAKAAQAGDLPQALFDQFVDDSLAQDGGARRIVLIALTAAYNTCREHDSFHKIFTQEVLIGLAKDRGVVIDRLDRIESKVDDVISLLAKLTESRLPDDFAKHRDLILSLATSYAKNPDGTPITDIDAALNNIRAALIEYQKMQDEGALPRNAADHLDAVLARVNALNQRGEIASAGDELARARAAQRDAMAEQAAGMIRLLDTSITQSRLQNRPEQTAALLVEKLQLDGGATFDTTRNLFKEWYERGYRQGLNFDAAVAIELARATLTRAKRPDQRVVALNSLGNALWVLGEREAGTDRLKAAIVAYNAALKETSRGRDPLGWAGTQNNIGNALQELGEREAGTKQLQAAVVAFTEALKESTRARAPLDWARTQNNLGNTFWALGRREVGAERLKDAVKTYTKALMEYTRARTPLDWAMTQDNLGNALTDWGRREAGTERMQAAVAAHRQALQERTRESFPLDWARTQNNLGNSLTELGRREGGTERLREAVVALTEALQERTRERVPLDWATSLGNRSIAQSLLADRCDDLALARSALQDLETAEPLLRDGGHIHFADYCAENIPAARAVVQRLSGAVTH